MKIGFLITNLIGGGAARQTVSLANQLAKQDIEIFIIKLDNNESFYEINNNVNLISLNDDLLFYGKAQRVKKFYRRVKQIKSICISNKITILFCMNISMITSAVFALFNEKTKVIGSERSNPYISLKGSIKQITKKIIPLFVDGFVFQTESASMFYPKKVRKKSIIIPNAINAGNINTLELPEVREKRITSVGRLLESKGFDFLIAGFNEIKIEYPEYILEIYGEGPDKKRLENLINYYELTDRVYLKGHIPNVLEKIYNSSLFIFPSRHEGMPNALIEALACGLPCISTDCDMGPRELIKSGINGILIDVDNKKQLIEQMKLILDNKQYSNMLSTNAIKIRENNSIEKITKIYIDYFESVMNN